MKRMLPFTLSVALLFSPSRLAAADDAASEAWKAGIEKIAAVPIEQKRTASLAVGVVKDGQVVLARGFGFADLENEVPATADTVYRLGSITKQFTSMAVMLLAEQRKLSLEDEITKFLPDFPLQGHKVTIHHLLNHTSGIKSYTAIPGVMAKSNHMDITCDDVIGFFKNEPFEFEPGAKWKYNNSAYFLLGSLIEKASGQTYSEFLAEKIFKPLDMNASRYGDLKPLIPRRAPGYQSILGSLTNSRTLNMNIPGAAGSLVSSVNDLVKWHLALEQGKLASSSSYEAMYTPTRLADGKLQQYGYGWALGELNGHRLIQHGGGINGFSTMLARYPEDRLAVIVLSNTEGMDTGRVERQIAKLMLGIPEVPVVDMPIDADLLKSVAGAYEVEGAKFQIAANGNTLEVTLPGGRKDRLQYQGNFVFVPLGQSEMRVTFKLKDGRAEGFELNGPNQKSTATRATD